MANSATSQMSTNPFTGKVTINPFNPPPPASSASNTPAQQAAIDAYYKTGGGGTTYGGGGPFDIKPQIEASRAAQLEAARLEAIRQSNLARQIEQQRQRAIQEAKENFKRQVAQAKTNQERSQAKSSFILDIRQSEVDSKVARINAGIIKSATIGGLVNVSPSGTSSTFVITPETSGQVKGIFREYKPKVTIQKIPGQQAQLQQQTKPQFEPRRTRQGLISSTQQSIDFLEKYGVREKFGVAVEKTKEYIAGGVKIVRSVVVKPFVAVSEPIFEMAEGAGFEIGTTKTYGYPRIEIGNKYINNLINEKFGVKYYTPYTETAKQLKSPLEYQNLAEKAQLELIKKQGIDVKIEPEFDYVRSAFEKSYKQDVDFEENVRLFEQTEMYKEAVEQKTKRYQEELGKVPLASSYKEAGKSIFYSALSKIPSELPLSKVGPKAVEIGVEGYLGLKLLQFKPILTAGYLTYEGTKMGLKVISKTTSPEEKLLSAGGLLADAALLAYAGYRKFKEPLVEFKEVKIAQKLSKEQLSPKLTSVIREEQIKDMFGKNTVRTFQNAVMFDETLIGGQRTIVRQRQIFGSKTRGRVFEEDFAFYPTKGKIIYAGYPGIDKEGYQTAKKLLIDYGTTPSQAAKTLRYTSPTRLVSTISSPNLREISEVSVISGDNIKEPIIKFDIARTTVKQAEIIDKKLFTIANEEKLFNIKSKGGLGKVEYISAEGRIVGEQKGKQILAFDKVIIDESLLSREGIPFSKVSSAGKTTSQYKQISVVSEAGEGKMPVTFDKQYGLGKDFEVSRFKEETTIKRVLPKGEPESISRINLYFETGRKPTILTRDLQQDFGISAKRILTEKKVKFKSMKDFTGKDWNKLTKDLDKIYGKREVEVITKSEKGLLTIPSLPKVQVRKSVTSSTSEPVVVSKFYGGVYGIPVSIKKLTEEVKPRQSRFNRQAFENVFEVGKTRVSGVQKSKDDFFIPSPELGGGDVNIRSRLKNLSYQPQSSREQLGLDTELRGGLRQAPITDSITKSQQKIEQKIRQQMKSIQGQKVLTTQKFKPVRPFTFNEPSIKPFRIFPSTKKKRAEPDKQDRAMMRELGYDVLKISKKKPQLVAVGVSRRAGLDIGTKEILKDLRATFFLRKSSALARDVSTMGEFDFYKTKFRKPTRGSRLNKYGEVYVQKQTGKGGRLSTRGELREIQIARSIA